MLCSFLCCCITLLVLSKPISLQRPAPCSRTRVLMFFAASSLTGSTNGGIGISDLSSKQKQHKQQDNNVIFSHPKSSFACRWWCWTNRCIAEIDAWWQRRNSTYCWTTRMQSVRNSSIVLYSSHSEQALICLRQLHFYDHDQAFFSAFFIFMCTVLQKLCQWGTPIGRNISVPPCQRAIF